MSPARSTDPRVGPTWTRSRLQRVMRLRFGSGASGVDTRAVAEAMGVTQRSVQRWLHAPHGRSLARIPPRRMEQLITLLLPSEETQRKEAQQARYAVAAIEGLALPREMGIKPAWKTRRWLEQHLVVVLEVRVDAEQRIRQLAVGRNSLAKSQEFRRRGRILDQAVAPTRFHATVLAHRVLSDLAPWRYQAGAGQVAQGFTQAWLPDAPDTHLSRTCAEILEELTASRG
jgi:hypothetical protein